MAMSREYDPDDDRRFKELAATMRTETGLPICFNCEKVGHTKKVCRIPRRKGTRFEEKFNERGGERSFQSDRGMGRNFQERGGMDRNFQDRGFQDRSFQPKSFPERGGYQDRIRDRSPISRPSRLFSERETLPYRRPSPPSFRSNDTFRRLDAAEAEVRCERLEEHLRKLQDEILDLRAEARSTRMVPSRPRQMRMPSPEREVYEEEGQIPGVVKTLAKLLRTDDNQPICFECGKPGHTRRNCFYNN